MGTLTAPPNARFLTRIRRGKMAGVVFLGNDWLTRSTVRHVTAELQQAACTRGEPLLIALDQEGGIVKRLAWAPPTEAPADMTSPADAHAQAAGDRAALRKSGVRHRLRAGRRHAGLRRTTSSAHAPSRASRTWNAAMAKAFVRGLQQNGIAATAKHFPGLGLASGNTDNGQITINASKAKIEPGLLPFQAAIKAGVKLVMVDTAIYPHLDASRVPAAFSSKIINGILRQQLGFKGVTVTDSLTAPAPSAIPRRGDESDARRLRPPHLGSRECERAGLRDARRTTPRARSRSRRGSRRPPAGSARSRRGSPPTAGRAAARDRGARASRRRGATSGAPSPAARGRRSARAAPRSPVARVYRCL